MQVFKDHGASVDEALPVPMPPVTQRGYTGRTLEYVITYILRDVPQWGLEQGFCIYGFRDVIPQQ